MSDNPTNDDGERIVVYANRRHMRRQGWMMSFLTLLCVVGAGSAFILPQDPLEPVDWRTSVAFFGFLACLTAALSLISFARSRKRRPTLIVNADGITDRCSSITGGRGLMPWQEIAWVGYEIRPGPGGIQQPLVINLFQSPTASAHKPRTEIPSPSAPFPFTTTALRIDENCLDKPAAAVVYEIERYIKARVPAGWHGWLSHERGEAGKIIAPPDEPIVG